MAIIWHLLIFSKNEKIEIKENFNLEVYLNIQIILILHLIVCSLFLYIFILQSYELQNFFDVI